jgi:hypothetical protein
MESRERWRSRQDGVVLGPWILVLELQTGSQAIAGMPPG